MRKLFACYLSIAPTLLLFSCAGPITQFYPDSYYSEDRIYENKPLRFIVTFRGNWILFTDPNTMDKGSRSFALDLRKQGLELLFVGATNEGLHGTRGIAVDFNEPANEYAEQIRRINKSDVQNDRGLVEFIAGKNSMIKWVYDKSGFRFVEFFFTIDTYDIRIAFWTRPDLFDNFLPVFEDIIGSLQVTGGL